MTDPRNISIFDFNYELPAARIALHPLASRDASRLLVYKNGSILEDVYKNIDAHLPAGSLLIFNNTRVINARLRFKKPSGGGIEIFCLEPDESVNEYSIVMNKKASVRWKCMIGGAGKWKTGELSINHGQITLHASLLEKLPGAYLVEFSWMPAGLSFAEVLEEFGDIPLPPYIKRETEKADTERYQTIYALEKGSVAAPTAGLHFTEEIFDRLDERNMIRDFVTLHVGSGTFKPVKALTMADHEMHAEWIDVRIEMIENLLSNPGKTIVSVGTTSLRTLESLYWMGVKVILQPEIKQLQIKQWEVYEPPLANSGIPAGKSISALLNWMKDNRLQNLFTQSQILIAPGYRFKIANALITNFHQPQSTLLLLVAAAIGNDWRKLYDHALQHDFRFLSYGDGSLLFIGQ